MNQHIEISEETQLRMAAYNRDVAKMIFDAVTRPTSKPVLGLSDEDYDAEKEAQNIFFEALGEFVGVTQRAITLGGTRKKMLTELLESLEDLTPNAVAWSEAINAKRRGWE